MKDCLDSYSYWGQYGGSNYFSSYYQTVFTFTRLRRFEPLTVRLEGVCSIQLS